MKLSSRRRAIAITAGLALVAGTSPALGVPVPGGVALPAVGAVVPAAEGDVVWAPEPHVFTLNDVIGNALGETDADNPNVIKDEDGTFSALSENPIEAKDGSGVLYPINSEFGFDVMDFVGATPKTFDDIAEEGWVGEFTDERTGAKGLQFSDADTAVMKAENLVGTWAAGLGGNEIKASTEHFTVMEAVLSCYQTVKYDYWASEEDYDEDMLDGSADMPVSAPEGHSQLRQRTSCPTR